MGKKNKPNIALGKALINDKFSKNKNRKHGDSSALHTTELNDGYDWNKLNLRSVTEESSFQEFISTAELAGHEFEAEKLNVRFIKPTATDIISRNLKEVEDKHRNLLKIPRRPAWTQETTPEELQELERESFLRWRRNLAILQEDEGFLLTPYEKNLEFWRQLWRVIERSDVVVQIIDARNPLMFRCLDLEKYVKEVDENKENVLLLNKADFLTDDQRKAWADYFTKENIKIIFFSAIAAQKDENNEELQEELIRDISIRESNEIKNSERIYTQRELIVFFKTFHQAPRVTVNKTTIGLVGYPNVGKSSTLNSLLCAKKVAVSATPGKTKHFQTFNLDDDIILCDCPGLVMPSFVSTKSDMIINGILPIDQMRDHIPPINQVASLIPRSVFEDTYGFILPEAEDSGKSLTSEQLLNAFGYSRGFMTQNGLPDNPRSARYVLKDFVSGKLLYCFAPPGVEQETYHTFPERKKIRNFENADKRYIRAVKSLDATTEEVDRFFFQKARNQFHERGTKKILMTSNLTDADAVSLVQNHGGSKPWKQINKHKNKNKREKLRRVYKDVDNLY